MSYFWQVVLVVSLYLSWAAGAKPIAMFNDAQTETHAKLNTSHNVAPLRIAVAANFTPVLKPLLRKFSAQTGIQTQIISGASGAIFLQIKYGAPYDVFLSADITRPLQLEQSGQVIAGSRTTYAIGQLAFYSPTMALSSIDNLVTQLSTKPIQRLAIANPEVAPYGKAAKEALEHMQLWQNYHRHLVTGINITQTFTQIRSQSISQGFIALSQLRINKLNGVLIPSHYHQPIKQQLVILQNTRQPKAAEIFRQFILSAKSQAFIAGAGYAATNEEAK